jgi:hypothetical protein
MAKKNSTQDGLQQERRLIEWMRQDLHAGFNRVVEVYQRHLQQVAYDLSLLINSIDEFIHE